MYSNISASLRVIFNENTVKVVTR